MNTASALDFYIMYICFAMKITETTELTHAQKEAIYLLWNREYPEKIQYPQFTNFEKYLHNLTGKKHYLLINDEQDIKGWAFTFTRDTEKWFAILLDQSIQRQGYGTKLLNRVKEKETILNGWVMDHDHAIKPNGEIYRSPLGFYAKNNFVVTGTRLETEKISAVKIVWMKE